MRTDITKDTQIFFRIPPSKRGHFEDPSTTVHYKNGRLCLSASNLDTWRGSPYTYRFDCVTDKSLAVDAYHYASKGFRLSYDEVINIFMMVIEHEYGEEAVKACRSALAKLIPSAVYRARDRRPAKVVLVSSKRMLNSQ